MLKSTRFVIIQEGIILGIVGAMAYCFFPAFPLIQFYAYLGPIILGSYGIKSIEHIKNGKKETKPEPEECPDPLWEGGNDV